MASRVAVKVTVRNVPENACVVASVVKAFFHFRLGIPRKFVFLKATKY